ncbi:MAG: HU family DNA-binding protein [Rhodospirillales bacterium]|nr:HU family DNA-binding protein [Rhodospirillales bacterium]
MLETGPGSKLACFGRNAGTGEAVSISASTSPTFKAGKALRETVNAGSGYDTATPAGSD